MNECTHIIFRDQVNIFYVSIFLGIYVVNLIFESTRNHKMPRNFVLMLAFRLNLRFYSSSLRYVFSTKSILLSSLMEYLALL